MRPSAGTPTGSPRARSSSTAETYTLPINNGVNSLHGGLVGFGNHIWAAQAVHGPGSAGVQLTLVSPNGDASGAPGSPGCPKGCTGYPAQLTVNVTYTLNNQDQLGIHYNATNDSRTCPRCST